MDDSKIIELFFLRNEDAIRHTQDAYGRRLFVLADNIVRNDQDAEESVNDTYMKAWDSIPPQKPIRFFAYLARICRNFALDKLDWKKAAKRNAEVISLTQEMEACIPDRVHDREMEAKELGQILDAFLRTLTEENQLVFLRRYWFDELGDASVPFDFDVHAFSLRTRRRHARRQAAARQITCA